MGNKFAAVVNRCAIFQIMGPGPCQIGFIDHHGEKVLFEELQDEIDAFLPNATPLRAWVGSMHSAGNDAPKHYPRMPYVLYILTISPAVVLAVPSDDNKRNYCSGVQLEQGCMSSTRLALEPYWYLGNPKIASGSFWFSPSLSTAITYVPDEARTYSITLPDSQIELIAKDGEWEVQRNEITK